MSEAPQLLRRLGLPSAIAISVGGVIGSGIFLKPLLVAQSLPSEWWILGLWVGLGAVCLCGAFAYAELGAMFPQAGGQYAFLRESWGRLPAFLFGWVFFWAINAGTLAALAMAFAKYALPWIGCTDPAAAEGWPGVAAATVMITGLGVCNHFGVSIGAVVQNLSTVGKVGSLALIALAGLFAAAANPNVVDGAPAAVAGETSLRLSGLVTAFLGIFWAYEGWYQLPFNAAELRAPERDLPRGLLYGMLVLIGLYVAVNVTYLHVVPLAEMRTLPDDTKIVAQLTISRVFGSGTGQCLSLLVALSVLGAANPNLMSSPRAFYAMANDGLLPRWLATVHPRHGTPVNAIWVQVVWAVLLIVWFQRFHAISDFVVFASFLFYGLTVAGVYRLRRRRPDLPRPYRCTGYPVTPAVFVAVAVLFVGALLHDEGERRNAVYGLVILASGFPAWLWCRRHGERATTG